ncbi:3-deoxy-manno-octulosonate cytidylyltransferase [Anaerovibrio sp.]|uniref:3-deoxy-manno-octulosonate cytidylyltransferase n=1 Tax=Anaerovibrio sp. TaxID=1872532 RepID=UPI001B50045E|nr:3-deoxy-manno-octulosonate cytidylyltransferase [Anaerovibrio sp.]MBP3231621.1 3-deoxy-manno-octulosonate cytidylyltransferase [Anaerovibrio sp.]MBR2142346.1 3-deoxy-manno-octulosonate cytidylyltransferase [Anaerovibrio sp.]
MNTLCVIPARFASTRLPGKPLADIAGKPMIVRVYQQASKARRLTGVIAAVDDERVYEAVVSNGGRAMMTAKDHPTGTDRLAEVAAAHPEAELIINVQGDEPMIEPAIIDELAAAFDDDPDLQMATVKSPMESQADINNPNNVKVVTDKNGYALYFSRSPLPYFRENTGMTVYKHIGIYAYKRDFLLEYAKMMPTQLEQTESLEQLRALENGYKIKVIETDYHFVGVDTPEDLAAVNAAYQKLSG